MNIYPILALFFALAATYSMIVDTSHLFECLVLMFLCLILDNMKQKGY